MSGFFTVSSPLAPNMVDNGQQFQFNVAPKLFVFTDGSTVATNFNSCFDFFSVGTAASGQIDAFTIRLFVPTTLSPCGSNPGIFTGTQLLISSAIDITIQAPEAVNFAASLSPGEWVSANLAEPSSLTLFWAGIPLALLLGVSRLRRYARRSISRKNHGLLGTSSLREESAFKGERGRAQENRRAHHVPTLADFTNSAGSITK
jgi:hypothetical protein